MISVEMFGRLGTWYEGVVSARQAGYLSADEHVLSVVVLDVPL